MASRDEERLQGFLSKVSEQDEKQYRLKLQHLPFLFRTLHELAARGHGFLIQLRVKDIDTIRQDEFSTDHGLALGLQKWLRGANVSWKILIEAIFQPAGGDNQRLAGNVADNFKSICEFIPIDEAESVPNSKIMASYKTRNDAVKDIQNMLEGEVTARWYQMGIVLGAKVRQLEALRLAKLSAQASETQMLGDWLDNCGNDATWQRLVDAVGHEAGGQYLGLAKDLSEKVPPRTQTQPPAPPDVLSHGQPSKDLSTSTTGTGQESGTVRKGRLNINRPEDISDATTILKNLNQDVLKSLFTKLGLSNATVLNNYKGPVQAYADDLVREWIQGRDDVLKSKVYPGGPTWENLRKALEDLGHAGTAANI